MVSTTCPVDCICHTNPTAPCSEPGGCGSVGCRRTGSCPACQARDPEYGLVCEPCRRWFPVALASIPRLAEDARTELIPADDSDTIRILICETCGLTVPWTSDRRHARHPEPHTEFDNPDSDSVHAGWVERYRIDHTGGPAPSIAPDVVISGGDGEAPVPLDLHLHDLLADVIRDGGRPIDRTGDNWVQALDIQPRTVWVDNGTKGHREAIVQDRTPARDRNGYKVMIPAGDQIGDVPIAQVLDQEVRAWIDAGAPGSTYRPTPTIPELTAWLDKRLDWACDHYNGIDEFAAMLGKIRGQLMGALGEFDPEPERCEGVECNRCSLRMLFRRQDGTGDVECQNPNCQKVFSAEDYRDWSKHLGAFEKAERPPAEVAELLRARNRTADLRRV